MAMRKTLLGAVVLALLLAGCTAEPSPPVAAPVASGVPSAQVTATSGLGAAPGPSGALDGKRQLLLLPRVDDIQLPDSVLAVTASGRVQVIDDYVDRALFVPVPRGGGSPERLIKTATLRGDGKPLCLEVHGDGAEPLTVVTAACDAGAAGQLFTFEAAAEDAEGRATYAVRNRDAFLQWHPMGDFGLVAEKLGDSPLKTTFSLQDQGPAALS
jgi:hypothetical protein